MTHIRMNWEDMTLVCSGHAGAGEKGNDLVCAGVSALTYALLNTLIDAEERGRTRLVWKIDEEKGETRIQAEPLSGYRAAIMAYYRVTMMGYKALAEHYPENIKIGEVRVHGNL